MMDLPASSSFLNIHISEKPVSCGDIFPNIRFENLFPAVVTWMKIPAITRSVPSRAFQFLKFRKKKHTGHLF